jgi:hypothetical protein
MFVNNRSFRLKYFARVFASPIFHWYKSSFDNWCRDNLREVKAVVTKTEQVLFFSANIRIRYRVQNQAAKQAKTATNGGLWGVMLDYPRQASVPFS